MVNIKTILSTEFRSAIIAAFGNEYADVDPLIQVTGNNNFGDYQSNLAMSLASKLGEKPRDVAEKLIANLAVERICEKTEVAGPGFINLYLDKVFINEQLQSLATSNSLGIERAGIRETIVVDYSAPNIAKEMHVGHLRSTVIGDAIARIYTRLGHKVIRQNHMGDWGTQFGMLIEHMIDSGRTKQESTGSLGDIELFYRESKRKFDSDPDFSERARNRVVALQGGDEFTLELWEYLVRESIEHFMEVYSRLDVLLTEEDNCPESFYNSQLPGVVDFLEQKGLVEISEGAAVIFLEGFKDRDDKPLPMIVRKSDGGYLYSTTDLAAIQYRVNELQADRIIYITDARQSQHFAMLFAAAKKAGWVNDTIHLHHMPFGSVLGADRKPFKTRDGGTVRLIDLLDEAESRARRILDEKKPDLPGQEKEQLAKTISVAALKYSDLSNDRIKDYVFEWDRMLALDGNTAPYLQNACVRIFSIFRKGNITRESIRPEDVTLTHTAEKALGLKLLQYPAAINAVVERLEPHRLCTYLYELAAMFHTFYEACPILKPGATAAERAGRLALCDLTVTIISDGLSLLGIRTVEKM